MLRFETNKTPISCPLVIIPLLCTRYSSQLFSHAYNTSANQLIIIVTLPEPVIRSADAITNYTNLPIADFDRCSHQL